MRKQGMLWVSVAWMCGLAACAAEPAGRGDADDDQEKTSESQSGLTECWPVGALYFNACDTSEQNIRDRIPQHAQIDVTTTGAVICGDEIWYQAVYHALNHHGWVRGTSLCP